VLKWRKQGLLFQTAGEHSWSRTHAAVPTVDVLDANTWRIYYATRDAQNRSLTSFIDVDAHDPTRIVYTHDQPIMPLGELGAFDDCGVMPSWIVNHQGVKYLYYTGWTLRQTVPFHNAIGLAASHDGGRTFERVATGPVFGLTHLEPHFTGTSCVLIENGVWRNWYMSSVGWQMIAGRPEPRYHLKYAESADGITWKREGRVALDFKSALEGALVRASVIRKGDGYAMWYSYRDVGDYRNNRAHSYRIGYAESDDGLAWQRLDEQAGIDVSAEGWDADMLCYPHITHNERGWHMFYNGNGFGLSGFGYAHAIEGETSP
jgi:hypothetical protein